MGSGYPWQHRKKSPLPFVQGEIQGPMLCNSVDAGMGWEVRFTHSRRRSCHWELCHPSFPGVSPPLFGAHRWPQRCSCCSMGWSDPLEAPIPSGLSCWSRPTSRCWLQCCHAGTASFQAQWEQNQSAAGAELGLRPAPPPARGKNNSPSLVQPLLCCKQQSWGKGCTWGWQVSRSACFTPLSPIPGCPATSSSSLLLQNHLAISPASLFLNVLSKVSIRGKGGTIVWGQWFWIFPSFSKALLLSLGPDLHPETFTLCGQGELSHLLSWDAELLSQGVWLPVEKPLHWFPFKLCRSCWPEGWWGREGSSPSHGGLMTVLFRAESSPNSQNPWKGWTLEEVKKKGEVTLVKEGRRRAM